MTISAAPEAPRYRLVADSGGPTFTRYHVVVGFRIVGILWEDKIPGEPSLYRSEILLPDAQDQPWRATRPIAESLSSVEAVEALLAAARP